MRSSEGVCKHPHTTPVFLIVAIELPVDPTLIVVGQFSLSVYPIVYPICK